MTAPQQQKLRIKGPVVITGNRLGDGAVVYRTQDRRLVDAARRGFRHHRGRKRDRASEGRQCERHRGGRRLCRAGIARSGQDQARQSARAHSPARPDFRASGSGGLSDVCLRRVRPHAGCRTGRRFSRSGGAPVVGRTLRRRVQAAAPDERRLSATACLYAAGRDPLWHAVIGADAHACACRASLRSRLRPFHHPAEYPVQLDQARRNAGRAGGALAGRSARDADQRQLHPQRHQRSMGRRRARRGRGPAHPGGNPAPAFDHASGILVPAAQVQDRGDRGRSRPRRHPRARHRPSPAQERRGRGGLRGGCRRRARPHAVHRQDHQAVPAQARPAELCRGGFARL